MSEMDEKWMAHALQLAQQAYDHGEVPVGAVIVRDGVAIGEGWNQPIGRCDPSAHAEILALRDAGAFEQNYRLPGATLYVTIEPCTMCLGALIHARIARVVYGAAEPKAGVCQSHQHIVSSDIYNHQIDFSSGILEARCTEIMQSFFKMRREQHRAKKKTP